MANTFLTAEWHKLIMVNYEAPASTLIKYLPPATELDVWNNKCMVSLVGFRFMNTKVKRIAVPFHQNFTEINLRFYVKYKDNVLGWKRGTVFIKEIVPLPAITFVARSIYGEKYETLKMKHSLKETENGQEIEYACYSKQWHSMKVIAEREAMDMAKGSEQEFIAEHYWGYTKRNKGTAEYAVEHPRWQVYGVKTFNVEFDFKQLYGPEFEFLNNTVASSVFLAEGSAVRVLNGKSVT